MPERSCMIPPPAGRDRDEYDKALRDAALYLASEFSLPMHVVTPVPIWDGARIVTGWRVAFRDDAGKLPRDDGALADLIAARAEREWRYLFLDDDAATGAAQRADAAIAALFAMATRKG